MHNAGGFQCAGDFVRNAIRLSSGLVLMAFVVTHLLNHSVGLLSINSMDKARLILNAPWSNIVGGPLLILALVAHILLAFYTIYQRTSLKMSTWEASQLGLGLAIPILLGPHLAGVLAGQWIFQFNPTYEWVIAHYWVIAPWEGVVQAAGLFACWIHGSIGIHYWLRLKEGYAAWAPFLLVFAIALPVAAMGGYVSAGFEALRLAADPAFTTLAFAGIGLHGSDAETVGQMVRWSTATAVGMIAVPFALRGVRALADRARSRPTLILPDGQKLSVQKGATVLETLRAAGVPHASVCGGRGRCTTCRVRVLQGADSLGDPDGVEAKALSRIDAPPGMRLACQICPVEDTAIVPLLPPRATAAQGRQPGGLEGQELDVTFLFIDLRGSTKLGETKLPYDVLFILNQFFAEMTKALQESNGHYAQFNGDGLMAIFGMSRSSPEAGARDALVGAAAMLRRIEELNQTLESELPFPLSIGIGINSGEAIVGAMGPPNALTVTAIGDSVNTAARLEALCKDHGKPLVISQKTAQLAGLALPDEALHALELRGRSEATSYYVLDAAPEPSTGVPA